MRYALIHAFFSGLVDAHNVDIRANLKLGG